MCILSLVCNGHMINSLKATRALVDDKIPGQMKTGLLMESRVFTWGRYGLPSTSERYSKPSRKYFTFFDINNVYLLFLTLQRSAY